MPHPCYFIFMLTSLWRRFANTLSFWYSIIILYTDTIVKTILYRQGKDFSAVLIKPQKQLKSFCWKASDSLDKNRFLQ